MPLTVEAAIQAGQLAEAITTLTDLSAGVQAAIDNGIVITQMDVRLRLPDGSSDAMHGEMDLTAEESASIFRDVIAIYESRIAGLNEQLTAIAP